MKVNITRFLSLFLNRDAITKDEPAKHCRRRTRGVARTKGNIEALLLAFSSASDTLGVPLFKSEIKEVWMEQQKHLLCIQDPEGIQLYTLTGHITKGGDRLLVYRCARGSTSLESFHLHFVDLDQQIDEGFVDHQDEDSDVLDESINSPAVARYELPVAEPVDESGDDDDEDEVKSNLEITIR